MIEKDNRPVNLNLLTISLPVIGLSSILHRLTGLAVFFSFPLVVWIFSISLKSEESFTLLANLFADSVFMKLVFYLIFVVFTYHLVAGTKKLLSDFFGIGETLQSGRNFILGGFWDSTYSIFGLSFYYFLICFQD